MLMEFNPEYDPRYEESFDFFQDLEKGLEGEQNSARKELVEPLEELPF